MAHGNYFLPKIVLSSAAAATCSVSYRWGEGAVVPSSEVGRKGWVAKKAAMVHLCKMGLQSRRNRFDFVACKCVCEQYLSNL